PLKTQDWPAEPAISHRHRVKSLAKKTQTSFNQTLTPHPTEEGREASKIPTPHTPTKPQEAVEHS
ncbi:hypothetical protein, partial [Rhodococcus sp. T7]|uniref:hypothetical protein n=1 Tax=Rhodococcus sp. T7 TaxID=627444 RepID=UPI001F272ADF